MAAFIATSAAVAMASSAPLFALATQAFGAADVIGSQRQFAVFDRPAGPSRKFELAGAARSLVGLGGVAHALSVASAAGWLRLYMMAPLAPGSY